VDGCGELGLGEVGGSACGAEVLGEGHGVSFLG
jgi:hypothetical protein